LDNIHKAAASENLPKYDTATMVDALLDSHSEVILLSTTGGNSNGRNNWTSPDVLLLDQYRSSLNYKLSAWDRLDTETNIWVLAALLFEWLEHLKTPILDKDSITYLVIHSDSLEVALRKLPTHVCFILEYLVRFVVRLKPIERSSCQDILRRLLVSLTHQSIVIQNVSHPTGKKFPKLRGGTAESTLNFLLKFYDFLNDGENGEASNPDLHSSYRLQQVR
jgi:protein tyrosine phosphatase domain-containing protein 1